MSVFLYPGGWSRTTPIYPSTPCATVQPSLVDNQVMKIDNNYVDSSCMVC